MPTLHWSPDDDAWCATLSNDAFAGIEIRVTTDGEASPPTERQLQAVAELESMTAADTSIIDQLARTYGERELESEELEEMEDEDFTLEVQAAVIPRLRDVSDTFVIFVGDSGIDVEHGLGCVCKNGKQFAVVDSSYADEESDWDSIAELDALFEPSETS